MKKERKLEIKAEAIRRLNEWLKHSSFDKMSIEGSRIRFNMSLGLLGGYPFVEPNWMKNKLFNGFVTEEEFDSNEYDNIIDELFDLAESLKNYKN